MADQKVRVRFAPSPTGHLHVGGARTALFNWLFARHHGGVFVLRLEDTDLERSTEGSAQQILHSLRWLGLDWDEGPDTGGPVGPYRQSQRLELYREYARKLQEAGRAYTCYCTPEELDQRRRAALARGEAPKYDRKCLNLSQTQRRRLKAEGRPEVVRFLSDNSGETVVQDLIRGEVRFDNQVLDDFVILKSDGMPTYNYAVVIDDALMGITHVIRGEDHLSNTPRQMQVYEALGFALPAFAHIPLILGPDRSRLSKRHGATSVGQFEEQGYLPEAMVNFLALLGWSYDDATEIFSVDKLIEKFGLDRVSKNPAVFDFKKLDWMNGHYLRSISAERLAELAAPFMRRAGVFGPDQPRPGEERERFLRALVLVQPRVRTLSEVPDWTGYLFAERVEYEAAAAEKFLTRPYVPGLLQALQERLAAVEPFDEAHIEPVFLGLQQELGLKLGDLIQPVRVAISGRTATPGMYEVLAVLGKERTLQRLEQAQEWILRARPLSR